MSKEPTRLTVLFKESNLDLLEWLKREADKDDVSMSSFVIRLLKKVMRGEMVNAPQPYIYPYPQDQKLAPPIDWTITSSDTIEVKKDK